LVRDLCDVYSGEDALNLPILACGGAGVISVLSNIVPADVKKMYDFVATGDMASAIALNDKLLPLANACFIEVNPIPVKEAMNIIGFNAGAPRAPLTVMEEANRAKLVQAIENYGLEIKA
jgi:4-hydroxy-tetrahydrodipicolinate synthase